MEFGDPIPPTLPNSDVLWKAKQMQVDKLLGISTQKPLDSLIILKATSHKGSIHDIGASPFSCMYWLPDQVAFHKFICDNDPDYTLTADASGGFVFKLQAPSEKDLMITSKYIFLYVVKIISKLGNVSLYQIWSSRHDASFLTFFFTEIWRLTNKVPTLFITDCPSVCSTQTINLQKTGYLGPKISMKMQKKSVKVQMTTLS